MKFIGNLIWLVFGGLITSVFWTIAGILLFISVIGIPFSLQCFKIAGLVLWPFGKEVQVGEFGLGGFLGNVIWLLLIGWELCLTHLIIGVIFSLTIIGIPFGKQHFKFASLSLLPFGAKIK